MGSALVVVTVLIVGYWWLTKDQSHRRLRDLRGVKPQVAVARITHAVTFTPKRRRAYRKLTLRRIAGRTLTTTVDGLDELFVIGKQARVQYCIGHSGNVYIDKVEPLP